jgi:hypothetical protein
LKLQSLRAPIEIPPLRLTLLWSERFHADPAHRWMRELITRTAGKIAEDLEDPGDFALQVGQNLQGRLRVPFSKPVTDL